MNGGPVIPYPTQFKQQIQCLALLLIQLSALDQMVMDGRDNTTVFAKREPCVQQNGGR